MTELTATPRLRVAHVSLGLEVGGQEKLLIEFARHADRTRFELLVIALGARGRLAEALEGLGCEVFALEDAVGLRPRRVLRLARLLRRERVDVVHTHDDQPLVYGMPAAWWAGVPGRVHTHHHGRLEPTPPRQAMLVRWASRLTPHFVCVSDDSARYVRAVGVAGRRVRTLHNGIDLARFPAGEPRPDGPAVTVARLSREKDLATLLHATRRVVDAAPDFRLEVAGAGPCRAELEALTAELRLTGQVRFHGEVSDVPALLGRARLFVLPSRSEGVSLTILEAMARGLPVVATRVGGNPEVVAEGQTGRLVAAADPAALAQALLEVHRDAELGRRLGRAGRRRAEENFDVRRMVARYEELYVGSRAPFGAGLSNPTPDGARLPGISA